MNKTHSKLLKIVIFLFALNSLSLCLYFSSHHHNSNNKQEEYHSTLTSNDRSHTENNSNSNSNNVNLKAWPILPSYLPWTQNPNKVTVRSCEAYFGNGFSRRIDVLSSGGWFRCLYSETLRSSICEGGSVRMVPERIKMSRGGERIEEVIGRSEEEELPDFENGAFEILGSTARSKWLVDEGFLDAFVPDGNVMRHTMRGLIRSIRAVDNNSKEFHCDLWIEEPTLLVTRFEYANLFHTITDWYSAYVASRVTDLPYRPHLIFVDGHSRTPLEGTWKALFSSVRYAKDFSGSVCLRHAVLVPLGYETALFKGLTEKINCQGASAHDLWQNPDDQKTARLSEFGEMIRAAFDFPVSRHRAEKPFSGHNVLFVRREDYLAHPRHVGKVESRLSNEQEVFDSLQTWVSNHLECKVNLINGLFAHMSMKEQVRAVQDASVIIGAHGAGLTHIVSATPKTIILEIISSYFRRPHFQLIAEWKGLEYHAINLDGSYAHPSVVIDRFSRIMKSLGC
ncbi:beta-1,2-xylosyltransferase [Populus nigra]|uniref:beta-1,2-xylosyltransferase n=1 Tax=Populus nigra TaxID=3691 RepID=UPI002B27104B|nr:beta-1,2-xylosyltransferase [Populus nigra]